MLVFCVIGLLAGWACQVVVREHVKRREETLFGSEEPQAEQHEDSEERITSTESDAEPMGT